MYCKYCGKEISDDSKFCKHCGKQVEESNETKEVVKQSQDDVASKVDVVVSTKKNEPTKIEVTHKPNIKNAIVANEVLSNIKMILFAGCLTLVYLIVFYLINTKNFQPLKSVEDFGSSCYDTGISAEDYPFSWEKYFLDDAYSIKPYNEWSYVDSFRERISPKDTAMILLNNNTFQVLSISYGGSEAEKDAREYFKKKKIPKEYVDYMEREAKEKVPYIEEEFLKKVTEIRKLYFDDYLKNNMKWCVIISILTCVLGRYIIKFSYWVKKNKTE